DRMMQLMNEARAIYDPLAAAIARVAKPEPPPRPQPAKNLLRPSRVPQALSHAGTAVADALLSGPQQRILDALAWLETVRMLQVKRTQVALLAERIPTSSAYSNNLGALRNEKRVHPWPPLITYPGPGLVSLTDAGRAVAHVPDTPP